MKREKSSRNFRMSGFTPTAAAFNCCHIRIKATNKNSEKKNPEHHSIVLQDLVDNRYLFRDIFAG